LISIDFDKDFYKDKNFLFKSRALGHTIIIWEIDNKYIGVEVGPEINMLIFEEKDELIAYLKQEGYHR